MADTKNHPVWSLYDEMRTARLNVKCCAGELRLLSNTHHGLDIITAIASTSSIGGFWFLQNVYGSLIWKIIGALAIIATTLKPVLRLTEKIRHLQELLTGYQVLDHDLHCICIETQYRQAYDNKMREEFMKALKRKADLVKKGSDTFFSKRTLKKYQEEVNAELPLNGFYIPEKI